MTTEKATTEKDKYLEQMKRWSLSMLTHWCLACRHPGDYKSEPCCRCRRYSADPDAKLLWQPRPELQEHVEEEVKKVRKAVEKDGIFGWILYG